MQDGSFFHAQYAAGEDKIVGPSIKFTNEEILRYTDEMSKELRKYSPNAEIILENDYSYQRKAYDNNYLGFGSFDEFDKYQWMGSVALANECKEINWIAPLGRAFSIARKEQGFTEEYNYLQYTDNYHPNNYGAYLKACVYYLIMFGEHFGDAPADCSVDSVNAKKLRDAAEKAVLTNREEFHVR